MSNDVKILLVVLIPLLILSFLFLSKNNKDSSGGSGSGGSGNGGGSGDGSEMPAPCTTLGRVEYLEEKRTRMQRIKREARGNVPVIDDLLIKYRTKALAAGKVNTADEILAFAYWAEADLEMKKDGFCYQSV